MVEGVRFSFLARLSFWVLCVSPRSGSSLGLFFAFSPSFASHPLLSLLPLSLSPPLHPVSHHVLRSPPASFFSSFLLFTILNETSLILFDSLVYPTLFSLLCLFSLGLLGIEKVSEKGEEEGKVASSSSSSRPFFFCELETTRQFKHRIIWLHQQTTTKLRIVVKKNKER